MPQGSTHEETEARSLGRLKAAAKKRAGWGRRPASIALTTTPIPSNQPMDAQMPTVAPQYNREGPPVPSPSMAPTPPYEAMQVHKYSSTPTFNGQNSFCGPPTMARAPSNIAMHAPMPLGTPTSNGEYPFPTTPMAPAPSNVAMHAPSPVVYPLFGEQVPYASVPYWYSARPGQDDEAPISAAASTLEGGNPPPNGPSPAPPTLPDDNMDAPMPPASPMVRGEIPASTAPTPAPPTSPEDDMDAQISDDTPVFLGEDLLEGDPIGLQTPPDDDMSSFINPTLLTETRAPAPPDVNMQTQIQASIAKFGGNSPFITTFARRLSPPLTFSYRFFPLSIGDSTGFLDEAFAASLGDYERDAEGNRIFLECKW